ncbi:MAG TPA: cytochrome c oxidase assembly protein [Actinomycetota bacterium]
MTRSVWGTWNWDLLTLSILAIGAVAYLFGVRALWGGGRRGRGVSPWRAAAFVGGLVAVGGALISPLDHASEALLSAHMTQHVILIVVAALLLVLGRPGLVLLSSLPPSWRRPAHQVQTGRPVRAATKLLTTPVVAWFLQVVVLWGWHVPRAYQAALKHPPIHWLEHASFLATAMLFWWVALEPGSHRRLALGGDVFYVLTAWLQGGALGALFAFAATPVYPAYALQAAAIGANALHDQQVAGLIMWIPGGLVYLGAACVLFVSWLKREEEAGRLADAVTAPSEALRA